MQGAEQLWELQDMDVELGRLQEQLADLAPAREAAKLDKLINELNGAHAATRGELDRQQREARNAELDVQKGTATIKELETKLYGGTVKSTKELSQVQARLEQERAAVARREEEALTAMQAVDELTSKSEQEAARLAKARRKREEAEATAASHRQALESRLAELERRRKALLTDLPPLWANRYERVRRSKPRPLAPLQGGVCGACHVDVPTSVIAQVKAKDKPLHCENCGRILLEPPA